MEGKSNHQSDMEKMMNLAGETLTLEKQPCSGSNKKARKLHKSRKNVKSKDEKDVSSNSKKWWCLNSLADEKEEGLIVVILSWGRERGFYFLGIFCLLMFALLFSLQAYLAFRSYKMLHQITTKKHIPETLYQIYFDGYDWALDLDKVDLRANTSLFIH